MNGRSSLSRMTWYDDLCQVARVGDEAAAKAVSLFKLEILESLDQEDLFKILETRIVNKESDDQQLDLAVRIAEAILRRLAVSVEDRLIDKYKRILTNGQSRFSRFQSLFDHLRHEKAIHRAVGSFFAKHPVGMD